MKRNKFALVVLLVSAIITVGFIIQQGVNQNDRDEGSVNRGSFVSEDKNNASDSIDNTILPEKNFRKKQSGSQDLGKAAPVYSSFRISYGLTTQLERFESDIFQIPKNKSHSIKVTPESHSNQRPTTYYRFYENGVWSEWERFYEETDHSPERLTTYKSAYVSGKAEKIQFRAEEHFDTGIKFTLFYLSEKQ